MPPSDFKSHALSSVVFQRPAPLLKSSVKTRGSFLPFRMVLSFVSSAIKLASAGKNPTLKIAKLSIVRKQRQDEVIGIDGYRVSV